MANAPQLRRVRGAQPQKYKKNYKHVEYSNQHVDAEHPSLYYKDVKFMKVYTIILISTMTIVR